jgi:hypothetical protein
MPGLLLNTITSQQLYLGMAGGVFVEKLKTN